MVATKLRAGSVAIVAYATDTGGSGDAIRFVILEPIGSGTQIFFTDRSWNGTAFAAASTGENTFTFTAGADMAAGTVVTITHAQLTAAGIDLSDLSETIYVYQGADANTPTDFLFAMNISDGTTAFEGNLVNTGLTNGVNAVAVAGDQGVYQGQGTEVPNTQLADIVDNPRWYSSDQGDIGGTLYDDRIDVTRGGPLDAADMQLFAVMTGGGQSDAILRIDNDEAANVGTNLARLLRDHPAFISMEDITFDLEDGVWFAVMNEGTDITRIVKGSIADLADPNQAASFTTIYEYNNVAADSNDDKFIQGIEIDKASNRIFFTLGDLLVGHNFMSVDYNGGNERDWGAIDLVLDPVVGFAGGIEDFVIDTVNNTAYFTYVTVDAGAGQVLHNYIVKLNAPLNGAANPAVENYAIVNIANAGAPPAGYQPGRIPDSEGSVRGVDYDPTTNTLWFVTGRLGTGGTGGIFKLDLDTLQYTEVWEQPSNSAHNSPQAFPTTLLHDIEVDSIGGQYYVTDQSSTDTAAGHDGTATDENGGNIWTGALDSAPGTAPTLFADIFEPTANGAAKGMEINYAPTSTSAVDAGGAVTEASSEPASGETTRVQVITGITVNDVDTTMIQGATVSISDNFMSGANQDFLRIGNATSGTVSGVTFSYNATTGVMTLSGAASFATYQSVLAQIQFSTSGDNPTNFGTFNDRTISFSVTDGLGWSDPTTATVDVTGINDAPVNTVGAAMNFTEDTTGNAVTGLSIFDVDADPAAEAVTVTLSVDVGEFAINTGVAGGITAGNIVSSTDDDADGGFTSITISATQDQINATLAAADGLLYSATADDDAGNATTHYNGAATLNIVTNDQGNNGNDPDTVGDDGTSEADTDTKTLNIADVNDAPTVAGDGTEVLAAILEDTPSTPAEAMTVAEIFGGQFADTLDVQFDATTNPTGSTGDTLAGVVVVGNGSSAAVGHWQYWDGSAWQNIGTVSETAGKTLIAGALVRFNPAADYNGAAPTLTVRLVETSASAFSNNTTLDVTAEGTGGTSRISSETVTLDQSITAVNDAPVIATLDGEVVAYTEGDGFTQVDFGGDAAISDVDSADFDGGTLTISFDAVTGDEMRLNSTVTVDPDTGAVTVGATEIGTLTTITGGVEIALNANATPALLDTVLRAVEYRHTTDDPSGTRTFTWELVDGDGTANSGADTESVTSTVTITPVNDAPMGADKTVTVNEDATFTFTAADFGFSDVDSDSLAGVVIESLPGAGTLLLEGVAVSAGATVTAADIAAGKLTFEPAADATGNGYASFDFKVQDDGGVDNGGADTDSVADTITFNVTAVNDAPTHNVLGTQTFNEDGSVTFSTGGGNAITVADVDAGGADLSTTLSIADGALALNAAALAALTSVTGDGTNSVTLVGTIAEINAALDGLVYTPPANANGSRTLSVTTNDLGATGAEPGLSGDNDDEEASRAVDITINSVSDEPSGADKTVSTSEDDAYTFTAADFGFSDPIDGDSFVMVRIMSLPGQGQLLLNGSTFPAGSYVTVADIEAGKLTFEPVADEVGDDYASFNFIVRDDGSTANGGIIEDQSQNTITIDVLPDNIAPVLQLSDTGPSATLDYTEDDAASAIAPTAVLTDSNSADFDTGSLTVSFQANGAAEDALGILAVGGITLSGTDVLYNGVDMGDVSGGGAGGGDLVVTFDSDASVEAVDALIQAVSYTNGSDTPSTLTRTVNFLVSDGDGGSGQANAVVEITIANDAPTHGVPGAQDVDEDVALVFSAANGNAITVSDADIGGGVATVVLSIADGTLTLGSTAGLAVSGNGTNQVSVAGTLADINAALDGLSYLGAANANGARTLTIATDDNGLTGPNLIVNPDAEAGTAAGDFASTVLPPGWTAVTGSLTAVQYAIGSATDLNSADSTAVGGGDDYFAGGPGSATSSISQQVDVSAFAAKIDAGVMLAHLSGLFGGLSADDDSMTMTVRYLSATDVELGTAQIGNVTPADRGGESALLERGAAGNIPAGTRSIEVVLTATRSDGTYNDGYADNLSLTLSEVVIDTVAIDIAPVDDLGVAVDDAVATDEATATTGDVLANDSDVDSPLSVASVNGIAGDVGSQIQLASGALLTLNADGTFAYDPNGAFDHLAAAGSGAANSQAVDSFTYALSDGSTATAEVTVNGIATPPHVLVGSLGPDTITGTSGADTFFLNQGGSDSAAGLGFGDIFNLGADLDMNDGINGGGGFDLIRLEGDYSSILTFGSTTILNIERINLRPGFAYGLVTDDGNVAADRMLTVYGGRLSPLESLFFDGSAETDGAFNLVGGGCDDILIGGAGDDVLRGRTGMDFMAGGLGDDTYFVTDAGDDVSELAGGGNDRVFARIDYSLSANVEQLILLDAGTGSGNGVANVLIGSSGDDVLQGLGGNDSLFGRSGDDSLHGGGQNDTLRGGAENDDLFGSAGTDRLFGEWGRDTLAGEDGNDRLDGGAASDVLNGGAGDDILTGRTGRDFLTGGVGLDHFVFVNGDLTPVRRFDVITDLNRAEGDLIDLEQIDADTGLAGDQGFTFIGSSAFSGTAGELRVATVGGDSYLFGDVDGNGDTDLYIRVEGVTAMLVTDFVL